MEGGCTWGGGLGGGSIAVVSYVSVIGAALTATVAAIGTGTAVVAAVPAARTSAFAPVVGGGGIRAGTRSWTDGLAGQNSASIPSALEGVLGGWGRCRDGRLRGGGGGLDVATSAVFREGLSGEDERFGGGSASDLVNLGIGVGGAVYTVERAGGREAARGAWSTGFAAATVAAVAIAGVAIWPV